MNTLELKSANFEINIPISYKTVIVHGDSATGKTYFVDKMLNYIHNPGFRDELKTNINIDDVEVVASIDVAEAFKQKFKKIKDKLIILDRADIYLDEDWIDFINNSSNRFIVMTRNSGIASEIECPISATLVFECHKKNGVVTIEGYPKLSV